MKKKEKEKIVERKHQTNFRLSNDCIKTLEEASRKSGKSKTKIVEDGISMMVKEIEAANK